MRTDEQLIAEGGTRPRPGPSRPAEAGPPRPARRRRTRGPRTLRALAIGSLAAGLFLIGGLGLLRPADAPEPSVVAADQVAETVSHPVVLSGTLDRAISDLRRHLEEFPTDWRSWATLGLAYVQQARVTADPRFYAQADGALERSLELQPTANLEAFTAMGALASARHDFAAALEWGERARAETPGNANVLGVIGDAQLELGRYEEAFATFQEMVDLRPDVASYARASYARELQGDVPSAITAMELALQSAGTPQDRAFAAYHLGELEFNRGRLGPAADRFRQAAAFAPEFVQPTIGLALVAWARGDVDGAVALVRPVVRRVPAPEHVILMGDLLAAAGRGAAAERQYEVARVQSALARDAGVNVDLEIALFEADHGDASAALRAAQAEWERRQSVHVADALAWSLHRSGRSQEALDVARDAGRLGYRSALFAFHRGMIELAVGDERAAVGALREALRINPYFSVPHAEEARTTLDELEAGR